VKHTHIHGKARLNRRAFLLLLIPFVLVSCRSYLIFDPADSIRGEVNAKGWRETFFASPTVGGLVGFYRPLASPSPILHVYIEGDGFAWKNISTPSKDPTPLNPVGLHLAFNDRQPTVLYLARPCQYQRTPPWTGCQTRYWTSDRFAPEIVEAMTKAIDKYKFAIGANRIRLFGYSGGGSIAALVAARRQDVALLVTISSPLDHVAWTRHHEITPLSGSLNPKDVAARLHALPQIHFIGEDDSTVPSLVAESFLRSFPKAAPTKINRVPDYGHKCCWARNWGRHLREIGL